MKMEIVVRRAMAADIETIAQNVVAQAYEGSQEQLEPATVLQGVTSLFNRPERGFYIVAEVDNNVVGSLLVVYEWSDWRNGDHWWIHSVYVQIPFRRQGTYSKMHAFVKDAAAASPEFRSLKLSTAKSNVAARSTYERLGMKESNSIIYCAT